EGEGRKFKHATGIAKFEASYVDMVRRLPRSSQAQEREGHSQRWQQQYQDLEFSSREIDLNWLEGSFTGFLKAYIFLTMLREGFQKEGIIDCEVRPLGQRIVLLTAIENGSLDKIVKDKEMAFAQWFDKLHPWSKQDTGTSRVAWLTCIARIAIQTQHPEVIQSKVSIKVDEDAFLITVAEESVHDMDRREDEAHGLRGNTYIDSISYISTSCVPDSFGQHIAGDHFPGLGSTPPKIVKNPQCKLALPQDVMGHLIDSGGNSKKHRGGKKVQVQGRAIRSEDSLHWDFPGPSGSPSLGFSSKAHPQFSGIEVQCYGLGDKGAELAGPIVIGKPFAGLLCLLAEPSQYKSHCTKERAQKTWVMTKMGLFPKMLNNGSETMKTVTL
ncbi:hypothetical protein Ancab_004548, partial [Ancistrocladus abbreviatus]